MDRRVTRDDAVAGGGGRHVTGSAAAVRIFKAARPGMFPAKPRPTGRPLCNEDNNITESESSPPRTGRNGVNQSSEYLPIIKVLCVGVYESGCTSRPVALIGFLLSARLSFDRSLPALEVGHFWRSASEASCPRFETDLSCFVRAAKDGSRSSSKLRRLCAKILHLANSGSDPFVEYRDA